MDYFNWNFFIPFIYVTVVIVISTIPKPSKPRVASLPLSFLLLQVCPQLLATAVFVPMRVHYPFRFSSMPSGEILGPVLYAIVEDTMAVGAGQGSRFREVFNKRYLASAPAEEAVEGVGSPLGYLGRCSWGCAGGFDLHNAQRGYLLDCW